MTWFYEKPRIEEKERIAAQNAKIEQNIGKNGKIDKISKKGETLSNNGPKKILSLKNREDVLKSSKNDRIIESDSLHGSINLKVRFDV